MMDNNIINQETNNSNILFIDKEQARIIARKLYDLNENLQDAYDVATKNLSLVDVLSEALMSFKREEAIPIYDFTVSQSVKVILDYVHKAFIMLSDLQDTVKEIANDLSKCGFSIGECDMSGCDYDDEE